MVSGPTALVVSPTGPKIRTLPSQTRQAMTGHRPSAAVTASNRAISARLAEGRAKQIVTRYPQQELYLRMPAWYNPAMNETKTSHRDFGGGQNAPHEAATSRGAFLVTLELEPDDLAALRVASPDHAGQAIFRLIDRLKAAR